MKLLGIWLQLMFLGMAYASLYVFPELLAFTAVMASALALSDLGTVAVAIAFALLGSLGVAILSKHIHSAYVDVLDGWLKPKMHQKQTEIAALDKLQSEAGTAG